MLEVLNLSLTPEPFNTVHNITDVVGFVAWRFLEAGIA